MASFEAHAIQKREPELELSKNTMALKLDFSEGLMAGTRRGNVLQTAATAQVPQNCARHCCRSTIHEQVGAKNGAMSHEVFESHAIQKLEPKLDVSEGTMAPKVDLSERVMAGTGRGNVLQTAATAQVQQNCGRHCCHSTIIEQVGAKDGAVNQQVFESHAIQKLEPALELSNSVIQVSADPSGRERSGGSAGHSTSETLRGQAEDGSLEYGPWLTSGGCSSKRVYRSLEDYGPTTLGIAPAAHLVCAALCD